MQSLVPFHVLRRGLDNEGASRLGSLPVWGSVLLVVTLVFFVLGQTILEYTFGRMVPTLIMVESPDAVLFEPLDSDDSDAPLKDIKQTEPDLMIVKQQPITSSFRSTLKHLQSRVGRGFSIRGFSSFLLYSFAIRCITSALSSFSFVPNCVAVVAASVLCSQLQMMWTHVVITAPSQQSWFSGANFTMRTWKKLAGPTAVLAIAEELAIILPIYLFVIYRLDKYLNPEEITKLTCREASTVVFKQLSVAVLFFALVLLIVIPANVSLTRVQASLLADNEETLIPFDRSFGGKVVPENLGGSGVLSMKDAWKTFDQSSRIRLIKAYAKVVAMEMFLGTFALGVFALELLVISGGDVLKYIPRSGHNEVNA